MKDRTDKLPYSSSPELLGGLLANPDINRSEHERYWPLFEALLPESASTVLDFGCGPGNFTELLAQKYPEAEVIGVDAVEALLPQTSECAEYVAWNGQAPLTTDKRFDLITAKMVLHYLTDAELRRLAHHLIGVLDKDGIIALSVPHPEDSSLYNDIKRDEWHRRHEVGAITRTIGSTGIEATMFHRDSADWINWLWQPLKDAGLAYTIVIDDTVTNEAGEPKRLNVMFVPLGKLDEVGKAYKRLEEINPMSDDGAIELSPDTSQFRELMYGDLSSYPVRRLP